MNLGNPNINIADTRAGGTAAPTAGLITGNTALTTGTSYRTIQVGAKLTF